MERTSATPNGRAAAAAAACGLGADRRRAPRTSGLRRCDSQSRPWLPAWAASVFAVAVFSIGFDRTPHARACVSYQLSIACIIRCHSCLGRCTFARSASASFKFAAQSSAAVDLSCESRRIGARRFGAKPPFGFSKCPEAGPGDADRAGACWHAARAICIRRGRSTLGWSKAGQSCRRRRMRLR